VEAAQMHDLIFAPNLAVESLTITVVIWRDCTSIGPR
jgi:hypothetical protein